MKESIDTKFSYRDDWRDDGTHYNQKARVTMTQKELDDFNAYIDQVHSDMTSGRYNGRGYKRPSLSAGPRYHHLGVGKNYASLGTRDAFMTFFGIDDRRFLDRNTVIDITVSDTLGEMAQTRSSMTTSVNRHSGNIPSVHKMLMNKRDGVRPGSRLLDMGDGGNEYTGKAWAERGVECLGLDPFNRPADFNRKTFEAIRDGGVETVVCANVLNVIDDDKEVEYIVQRCAEALAPDGVAYFGVYEGDASGEGRETGAGRWQRNQVLGDYVPYVEKYFDEVKATKRYIEGRRPKMTDSKAPWRLEGDDEWTAEYLRESVRASVKKVLERYKVRGVSESEIRGRDGYRKAISAMAEALYERFVDCEMMHKAEDLDACGDDKLFDFFNLIEGGVSSDMLYEMPSFSIARFVEENEPERWHYEDVLDTFIDDGVYDMLSDEERDDVLDDVDAEGVINKSYLGGGSYEAKGSFRDEVKKAFAKMVRERCGVD